MGQSRIVGALARVLTVMQGINYICGALFVVALIATLPFVGVLEARLIAKYGPALGSGDALLAMRGVMLVGLLAVWAVARLFSALAAMVASVRAGDPFVAANVVRLRSIGWSILALQLLDLIVGAASFWFKSRGIDYVDWTPSLIGWLAVLVAFVLAEVFHQGTAMRDDLADTI
ncbi:DUF2975 domain-containing protein [Sphingomonas sp. HF-S3]|uniref:DUF2975 domain-containing protein n=1 Tax=Sphingomonas rustica TaxID=3103142 RepID=A0ABV0BC25_9SPHN